MQEQTMQDKDFSTSQTFKRLWPMISPFKSGLFFSAVALCIKFLPFCSLIFTFSLIISFIKLALYIALKAHKVNYLRQIKSIYIVEIRQRCSSNLGRIIKYLLPL